MLLHYFFLAVFGWMLVEGINLYLKIVRVFGSENSPMSAFIVIGWVLPAIIVGISAAVDFKHYTSPNR